MHDRKVDVGGHDLDHTWTGSQPVPWDLAGAMEECPSPVEAVGVAQAMLHSRSLPRRIGGANLTQCGEV